MIKTENLSEPEIISRITRGEKSLFEILVKKYNGCLYKIGRSYNFTHEDTRDLMQDSFVDAYKNLHQFENRASLKTWMIRIMMNNCYRKMQRLRYKYETVLNPPENSTPMFYNSNNDTGKIVQSRELKKIMEDALSKIPFDYRIVFALKEINGLKISETAQLLNLTESNVKTRLTRSKKFLRNEIEKSFNASELFEFNLIYCNSVTEEVMKRINAL